MTSVTASVGYTIRSQATETPAVGSDGGTGGLSYSQESRNVPMNFSISWAPRLVTTLSVNTDRSVTDRTGNQTHGDRRSTAAGANFAFRFPQEFVPLKSDVRTSLRYLSSVNALCIALAGVPDCIRIADSRQTEYNLTMDTDMPPAVVAGLSIGYVLTDDRHLNRKFSQLTVTASARIFFQAGELR